MPEMLELYFERINAMSIGEAVAYIAWYLGFVFANGYMIRNIPAVLRTVREIVYGKGYRGETYESWMDRRKWQETGKSGI